MSRVGVLHFSQPTCRTLRLRAPHAIEVEKRLRERAEPWEDIRKAQRGGFPASLLPAKCERGECSLKHPHVCQMAIEPCIAYVKFSNENCLQDRLGVLLSYK